MSALADDTNVNSAMVSFSYVEDFTNGSLVSPFVSYQYANDVDGSVLASLWLAAPFVSYQYQESRDALLASGPIASPMVSYQYFEWAGDVLPLVWQTSPQVSYFYLSWSTPPASLSSSSVLTVSPSSVPADGSTPATVTVTLLDGNRNPVAGKTIIISAVEQATSGLVARLATITQPANPTDDGGQTTATLTSSTPGTVIISAQDATDSISLSSQPRVQFTPAFLPPTKALNDAIVSLTSEASYDLSPYIGNVALHEGQCGDYFQNQANSDRAEKAAIILNAGLGALLALVPLDEVLLPAGSALDRAFLSAEISLISDYNALGIGKLVEDIAGSSTGLSLEGQDIGSYTATRQRALLQAEQDLLAGVPPASVSLTAAFINDLALRQQADHTIKLLLINQDGLLSEMQSDSEFSHSDFLSPLFVTVDVIGSVFGGIAGGPLGGIAVNEAINAVESRVQWEQNRANLNKDQQSYLTAVGMLSSCLHYSDMIYLNTASGLSAVAQGRSPSPVTGDIIKVTSQLTGPQYNLSGTWTGADPVTTPAVTGNRVTSGTSLVTIRNTSQQSAAFTAYALYEHTVRLNALGINVASSPYSLLITGTKTVAAGQSDTISINYFDGANGGLPDDGSQVTIYVLGYNNQDIYKVGEALSTLQWPTPGPGAKDLTPSFTFENPVKAYVFQSVTNQSYQAQIWVANPFAIPLLTTVTQPLPPGITILATDGALQTSSIVWSNTIVTNGLVKATFQFSLPLTPGTQTNLPPPTVVFTDATGTNTLSIDSSPASFSGLFPVGVSAFVPPSGAEASMQVAVTNWTGTNQAGIITISLTNAAGIDVGDFSLAFGVRGFGSTNLDFSIPGTLPSGPYSVTAWLNMNGGVGQAFSGMYVMPPAPVRLSLDSTALSSTNGFTMVLEGPVGFDLLVQASTNLVDWQPIQYFVNTTPAAYITDPMASNFTHRFYRAMAIPP